MPPYQHSPSATRSFGQHPKTTCSNKSGYVTTKTCPRRSSQQEDSRKGTSTDLPRCACRRKGPKRKDTNTTRTERAKCSGLSNLKIRTTNGRQRRAAQREANRRVQVACEQASSAKLGKEIDDAIEAAVAGTLPTSVDDTQRAAVLQRLSSLLSELMAPVAFHANKSPFRNNHNACQALLQSGAISVHAFGSAAMNMHTPSSDVDCSLEFLPDVWTKLKDALRPRAAQLLDRNRRSGRAIRNTGDHEAQLGWLVRSEVTQIIAKVLRDAPQYVAPEQRDEFKRNRYVRPRNVQTIAHARVPIVKFVDSKTGLEVDISIASNGVAKSRSMGHVLDAAPVEVRKVARCFKLWSKCHQVNNSVNGTLNSYAILNLVLWALQQGTDKAPASIPPLRPSEVTHARACRISTRSIFGISRLRCL